MTVTTRLAGAILAVALTCASVALGLNYVLVRNALKAAGPEGVPVGAAPQSPSPPDVLEALDEAVRADAMRALATRSLASLAVTFAAGLVVSRILARRALRPIEAISAVIDECSEHDLSRRVEVRGPDDELTRLGRTVNQTLARLEEAFERQRLFVANASHELRTPLTLIRSSADVALNRHDLDEHDYRVTLSTIETAALRTQALLDRLLALARLDRDRMRTQPVRLDKVAATILESVSLDGERDREVAVDARMSPARVLGDPALIEAAVRNLIDNGFRYNIDGGWLELTSGTLGPHAWVEVSNSGEPLNDEDVRRLAEPFFRGSFSPPGSGLGLSIAAGVASVHGGALTVEPRQEGGLNVRLTLLAAIEPATPAS
jgi:signal transduction histidine kinase